MQQQGLDLSASGELELTSASNVVFNSMPVMHVNESDSAEIGCVGNQPVSSGFSGEVFSKSCPEPVSGGNSHWVYPNKSVDPSYLNYGYNGSKTFSPHWSNEAVNEALEVSCCNLYLARRFVNCILSRFELTFANVNLLGMSGRREMLLKLCFE